MQQRAHPKLSRNAHKSPPTATAMLRTCSIKQRLYANIDKVNVELEKNHSVVAEVWIPFEGAAKTNQDSKSGSHLTHYGMDL